MKNPKFKITKGKDGQYYFKLAAPNGKCICTSEGYKTKGGAIKGMRSVARNAPIATYKDGATEYWVLCANLKDR